LRIAFTPYVFSVFEDNHGWRAQRSRKSQTVMGARTIVHLTTNYDNSAETDVVCS